MKYNNELIELAELSKSGNIWGKIRRGSELNILLMNETSFLSVNVTSKNRMYYILNDIHECVKCPNCEKDSKVEYINNEYIIKFCSFSCNVKYINPITGKSRATEIAEKAAKTMKTIHINGLSIYDNTKVLINDNMNTIIPGTNKTKYQISAEKAAKTMSIVDDMTGLSIYDKNKVLTKQKQYEYAYNYKKSIFPSEFTLLTTLDEYNGTKNKLIKYQCKSCDSIRESIWPYIRCTICYPYSRSMAESEILTYCQELIDNVESNNRSIISPLELDVYLPDYDLAIEYNGLYWHSASSTLDEDKDYHLNKTIQCKEKGIQLLHIFENEWINPIKQDIWKSIIRNKLGNSKRIYGRKCVIKEVNIKDKTEFLNVNHLQGTCSSSINLGLYYENELVSLMTFGKSRYDKKIDWELLRYCNVIGSSVLGGASRLLKNFMSNYTGSIISYADRRRSDGGLYEKLRFELSHESRPNYFYYKDNRNLESRVKYQKHKLKDKLEVFDSNLTESENMYMNGYRKIYDCGNLVYKNDK